MKDAIGNAINSCSKKTKSHFEIWYFKDAMTEIYVEMEMSEYNKLCKAIMNAKAAGDSWVPIVSVDGRSLFLEIGRIGGIAELP